MQDFVHQQYYCELHLLVFSQRGCATLQTNLAEARCDSCGYVGGIFLPFCI